MFLCVIKSDESILLYDLGGEGAGAFVLVVQNFRDIIPEITTFAHIIYKQCETRHFGNKSLCFCSG
jgi:hypothetical protein